MVHASLFSGIGGPEVAASMLGWENAFHCEINPFGRAVLEYWFPNSVSYEDIKQTSFKEWRGRIDVLTGGFPCQPFSYAGKRGGRDDDRYLWPEMLRAIDEVRPTWVIGENVAGITTMVEGGVCADLGSDSSLFPEGDDLHRYELDRTFTIERICRDLEHLGYSVQPVLVPAAAVGAPHRRDRVFIVAFDANADLGADDGRAGEDEGRAGEDEGAQGEERVQERDNLHLAGDASEVRSPLQRLVEDSFGVRRDGGRREEEPRVREQRESCTGDNERVCGEAGTHPSHADCTGQPAPGCGDRRDGETDSEEREHNALAGSFRPRTSRSSADTSSEVCDGRGAQAGRERQADSNNEEQPVQSSTFRPCGEWTTTDPECVRLQHNLDGGSEAEMLGETGEGGEDRVSAEVQLASAEGGGRSASNTKCDGGNELHQHLQSEFADGIEPVGVGGKRYVADTESEQGGHGLEQPGNRQEEQGELGGRGREDGCGDATHADGTGREESGFSNGEEDAEEDRAGAGDRVERFSRDWFFADPGLIPENRWACFPAVSPVHRGNDGLPFPLDNLTISTTQWRTESLKAYGNAIVPQVMYRIFQAIQTISNK